MVELGVEMGEEKCWHCGATDRSLIGGFCRFCRDLTDPVDDMPLPAKVQMDNMSPGPPDAVDEFNTRMLWNLGPKKL